MRSIGVRTVSFLVAIGLFGASPPSIVQPSVGGTPWTADTIAKLDVDLDAMLATDPALHGAHYGVYAIDTASGTPLYAQASDDEIQPASTFKLLVGSAALDTLGPTFRFTTRAYYHRASLDFASDGDPTIDSSVLDEAAHAVRARGDSVIDLYLKNYDPSEFREKPFVAYPSGWTWDDFGQEYAPVVSSLAFEENVARVRVAPTKPGGWATVSSVDPVVFADREVSCDPHAGAAPTIVSTIRTGQSGTEDTVDVARADDGCLTIVGSIPADAGSEELAVSVDPASYMRAAILRSMRRAGVDISGYSPRPTYPQRYFERPTTVGGPGIVLVWEHRSRALASLLGPRFWIPSDNLFGELLLQRLSANLEEPSTDGGISYEKTWLQSIGIDPKTVTLADGCGMSQYDRITPRDLVTILQHDWNGPNRQLVLDSLPVGGARGTIEGISGTDAAGRVFAKTGSMMHVRGLAGYLATVHHGAVTFAFQVDDWNGEYPALAALRARVLSRIVDD